MKKILIPTDFSDNARNAVNFGVALANQFGSEIHLLYAYKVYSTTGMFVSVENFMEQDALDDMAALIKNIKGNLHNGASVRQRIVRGDTIPAITDIAEQEAFDLIVMGTQGASGLKEIFLGSTANGVIKAGKTPVLAVPSGWEFQPLKNIVLAVDEGPVSGAAVLTPLLRLANQSGAKILVFHQDTGEGEMAIDPSIPEALGDLPFSIHLELDQDRVADSINDFMEEYQAGLLCMIRRKRSFLERVFHSSITSKEVFHCETPLLVLFD